ncbi:MAG TPA: zf-HC2 domain-containing protein [Patescibacteria group bacterium]|nr:zf-HC2 domain-containing protein [Patescibacteria group bacterium]
MTCPRMEHDGMRYIDGEMTGGERAAFERHLDECGDCRRTLGELGEVNRLTESIMIKDPQDEFWALYWKSIYRRLERKTAWIFMIAGIGMLVGYELYRAFSSFGRVTFQKIALIVFIVGVVLLLVSVVRERIHQYRSDPYRDVKR